jgi:LPXTG-motif cell wall-anchored protein
MEFSRPTKAATSALFGVSLLLGAAGFEANAGAQEEPTTTTTVAEEVTTTTTVPETTSTTLSPNLPVVSETTDPEHCNETNWVQEPDGEGGFVYKNPETGEVCVWIKHDDAQTQVLGVQINRGELPRTGTHTGELIATGAGLLLMGAGFVASGRRIANN